MTKPAPTEPLYDGDAVIQKTSEVCIATLKEHELCDVQIQQLDNGAIALVCVDCETILIQFENEERQQGEPHCVKCNALLPYETIQFEREQLCDECFFKQAKQEAEFNKYE